MSLFRPPRIANLEAKKDLKGLVKALGFRRESASALPQPTRWVGWAMLGRWSLSLPLSMMKSGMCAKLRPGRL
jgi:hypothetical protein